jgi:hypothetical protein
VRDQPDRFRGRTSIRHATTPPAVIGRRTRREVVGTSSARRFAFRPRGCSCRPARS